jgi:hypothetical protein
VLVDVTFPAMKWQLVMHAEYVGADIKSRVELYRLPEAVYPDAAAVISTVTASLRPAHRRDREDVPGGPLTTLRQPGTC